MADFTSSISMEDFAFASSLGGPASTATSTNAALAAVKGSSASSLMSAAGSTNRPPSWLSGQLGISDSTMLTGASAIGGTIAGVGDIMGALGKAKAAAKSEGEFRAAAALAHEDIGVAETQGAVKLQQQDRAIARAEGSIEAGVAKSGFAQSGTAMDIMRDTMSQGALSHSMITANTVLEENSFRAQEQAAITQADAAAAEKGATKFGVLGGVLKVVEAVAPLLLMAA